MFKVIAKESGEKIVSARSYSEGKKIIKDFEIEDRRNGVFTPNYYDVVEEK